MALSHSSTASSVIQAHQKDAPVDVKEIAGQLGISVKQRLLPTNISGKLLKNPFDGGPSGYAIIVNTRHHRNRQRFTVAHELAHYVLHRDLIEDGIVDDGLYRSHLSDSYEAQANRLAANILMPYSLIKTVKREIGSGDPRRLAGIFGVSEQAMRIRLGLEDDVYHEGLEAELGDLEAQD